MIRKHSAKVLTLRNVRINLTSGEEETIHFVLIGGSWYYNGTTSFPVSKSDKDGFWHNNMKELLSVRAKYSLGEIKRNFYHGPNKSMQIAIREWTTNQPVYGVPF